MLYRVIRLPGGIYSVLQSLFFYLLRFAARVVRARKCVLALSPRYVHRTLFFWFVGCFFWVFRLEHLIRRKIIEVVSHKCQILWVKWTEFDFGWGYSYMLTPRLLGVYYFLSLTLSVCMYVCLFVTLLQIDSSSFFLGGIEPFLGHQFSMTKATKRCSSNFDLLPWQLNLGYFVLNSNCFFFFVFRWNRAIFGPLVLRDPLYKTLFFDFWFRPPNHQNWLPKIWSKIDYNSAYGR